jgi:hypothetical protein
MDKVRRGGWVLVAVGVVGLSLWIVARALHASTDNDFGRWVGWANVLALPLGGLGTVLVILDRVRRPAAELPAPPTAQVQNIQAFGGTAQGVMNGSIINHPEPPASGPST